jgi:transposase InsO family protein
MSELPSGPWLNISADFCGPLENGDYLLVVMDGYSRYPIVKIIKSISANTVILVFDKIVTMFAIPKVIKTDNGSQFQSKAFADFMKFYGIIHRKITPRWARANAQAESFNKPLMKSVKSSLIEARNYKQALYGFLDKTIPSDTTRIIWLYTNQVNVW